MVKNGYVLMNGIFFVLFEGVLDSVDILKLVKYDGLC